MDKKKLLISFVFLTYSLSLMAQNEKPSPTFEVTIATFQTNALSFMKDYEYDFEKDVFSDNSSGWSLGARRTQTLFTERLDWFVGARTGVHAYSIDLYSTKEFRDLGTDEIFTSKDRSYELFFAEAFTGLRYTFPVGERMKFGFEALAVVNYHFGKETGFGYSATLDNGETKELFDSGISINGDNKILIAPQIGVSYQYLFENSGLRFGANLMIASQSVLEGSYELYGDTETLTGTMTKDYSFGGLEIGYFWNL